MQTDNGDASEPSYLSVHPARAVLWEHISSAMIEVLRRLP